MSDASQVRRLAAIMFTDMVGYSAAAERSEREALALLAEQRRLVDRLLPEHGGTLIKSTGDGFLIEFTSAVAAVGCALALQAAVAERDDAAEALALRIGLHLGDVIHSDGDLLGDGVNIAARLVALAEPGGTCLSRAVFEQVQHRVEAVFEPLGEVVLKNLARPVQAWRARPGAAPAARGPTRGPSVAVLPFTNMSADQENEFLSDGITEDLITALSHIDGLSVAARTSSFAFKGKNEDIRRIGQMLGVSHVVEGSVRKAGQRLRIAAQLINVADGYHLWSERYDRAMRDVFEIQDEITQAIAAALELQLVGGTERAAMQYTTNAEAYELYLQGRANWERRGVGLLKAMHYFELALLEDPTYPLPAAGLAMVHAQLAFFGLQPVAGAAATARAAIARALAREPLLVEAATAEGWLKFQDDWDLAGAERHLRAVLAREPRYLPARYWLAATLVVTGRVDEGIVEDRHAVELEPYSPMAHAHLGWMLDAAGRFEEAIGPLSRARELGLDPALVHWRLGHGLFAAGRRDEGLEHYSEAVTCSSRWPLYLAYYGGALGLCGRTAEAEAIRVELEHRARTEHVRAGFFAVLLAGLGDLEQAADWVDRAIRDHDIEALSLPQLPELVPLLELPRGRALLQARADEIAGAEAAGRAGTRD